MCEDKESLAHNASELEDETFGYTLALCGISVLALEVLFLLIATLLKVDKVKDVAGGCTFVAVALLSLFVNAEQQLKMYHLRQILATCCVCLWALRLAVYLLYRHISMGQDKHYVGSPPSCCRHLGYWSFQALWVFIVSLPVMAINSSASHRNIIMWSKIDIAGTTVFGIGALFELIADQQKLNSKRNPLSQGKWCTFGFWKWSRHPNYFFEMVTWWGMFILSTQTSRGAQFVAVLSPLFVTFILLFVSGIPVVEAAADMKYGNLPDYRRYKRNTSVLLPFPPWLYRRLPAIVKNTLLLDFPCYNSLAKDDPPLAASPTPL